MTDIFNQTVNELVSIGVTSPRLEARMIFSFLLQQSQATIDYKCNLSPTQQEHLAQIIYRRRNHEPLDKIIGSRDFYKNTFIVNDKVLSPRPDSEILVEETIKIAQKTNADTILELGVGSGCLILSILSECPQLLGWGIDKSADALSIAKQNAENLNLDERISLEQGDYFVPNLPKKKFSIIISNPPYIATEEIETLSPEVKLFDPIMALDGGADGLEHYRQIAAIISDYMQPEGHILLEVGQGQANDVKDIFIGQGFIHQNTICDLSGIKRCIIFKK